MGLSDGIPNWNVYMAFSFFRVAAILQGVYKRSQMSESLLSSFTHSLTSCGLTEQASSDNAALVGAQAEDFANKGWFLAQRYGTSSTRSGNGLQPTARSYSTKAGSSSSEAHIGKDNISTSAPFSPLPQGYSQETSPHSLLDC